jgi:hypothetical protein
MVIISRNSAQGLFPRADRKWVESLHPNGGGTERNDLVLRQAY